MTERENNQPEGVCLPPVWCSSLCINSMNEICVESCALKRDASAFEPKPNLTIEDMPRFPMRDTKGMTKEEKFAVVALYLAKVVDHLKGIENEHGTFVVRRPHFDGASGSGVPANLQGEDLLHDQAEADASHPDREECEGSSIGSGEVARDQD